ncbi:alpha/beta hydrolase [Lactococcus formosensis]|uniref:alpha/beta hydrolase n=1 Tax=Lactococcus formosensis TaxID=1281486 RepID=UPI00254D11F8|nr:alpha/beta hydrolase [Lactococcus formosensis]
MKKKITILTIIFLIILTIMTVATTFYMYDFAFVPGNKSFVPHNGQNNPINIKASQWLNSTQKQEWHEISATDDLKLNAYYIPAQTKTKKTIIIAHGYMGKKEDMARYMQMYHDLGYNVLAPDDRGAGTSDGNYIGFGWPDRLDYVKWINKVIEYTGQDSQIALFGVSMGGATVMFTAGEKLPSQIKAVIEDCGYSSISAELAYQLKEMFHLPKFPLIYTTQFLVQVRAHYNFAEADATKALSRSTLPIFIIHGAEDKFVPTKMANENFNAAHSPKELWIVPKAQHAQSYIVKPQEYQERTSAFLNKYLK